MKAKYFLFTPLLVGFLYLMLISNASGPASAGNGNRTGSPLSNGTCSNCHSGGSFGTSITASVTDLLGSPVTVYIPGESYYVEYQVSSTSGAPKYGFQSIMLTSANANAGDFDSTLTTNTQITNLSGKKLPEQSAKSTTGFFKVRWVAPVVGTGTVTLYYIGNAVNSNTSTSGDLATSSQSLTLTEQPVFTLTLQQINAISCFGDSTASVMGTVINGVAPYTYVVNGGTPVGPIPLSSITVTNLGAGTYNVQVTDANGAVSQDSILISQPTQLQSSIVSTDESCFQMNNGSAIVTPSGGTTPYSYLWSNGDTTAQVSNLSMGSHVVTITDSAGCSILDIAIIIGASQIIIADSIVDPSCVSSIDGGIFLSILGGVSPYTYLWSNSGIADHVTGLDTGMFTVTVTDSHGCSQIGIYQLTSNNLPPVITVTSTEPTCFTSSDGVITASISGGTPPYSSLWNTGETTPILTNVDTGFYLLVVTDSVGCLAHEILSLSSNNIVPQVNLGPDTVICAVDVGGFAIDAGVLVNDYDYLWNTSDTTYSLTIFFTGNYWLQVTDSLGCVGSDSILVEQEICSGVEDLFDTDEVSVYPIPAKNILNIDTKNAGLIELYDVFGKKVISINAKSGKTQIDVSELSKGTYILRFNSENGVGIKKILIL